jgi:hypothetical protein
MNAVPDARGGVDTRCLDVLRDHVIAARLGSPTKVNRLDEIRGYGKGSRMVSVEAS